MSKLEFIRRSLRRFNPGNEAAKKLIEELIMALSEIGQDLVNMTTRCQNSEKLVPALQAQVSSLQASNAQKDTQIASLTQQLQTANTQSPEDQGAETAAEAFLQTPAPTDTTGALTPPVTTPATPAAPATPPAAS